MTLTDTNNSSNGVSVSTLNTLNDYTTGNIDATTISLLAGTAANLNTAYAAGSATDDGISNLGNEAVTVCDTTLAAATLNTLDGYTEGSVNAAAVDTFDWNNCGL